jgi:hypothetical protein
MAHVLEFGTSVAEHRAHVDRELAGGLGESAMPAAEADVAGAGEVSVLFART